ncbi:MAG: hypothetical protein KTV77_00690 [Wolbachia endosymbiont of Fragariocoptes setiger]|nr:hypothetical protein [Wolbachia endosymbiont of Fragariocoptes setiger]
MTQGQQVNTATERISNQSLLNEDEIRHMITTIINQKHEELYKELKGTKEEIKNYILKVGISTTLLNIASSIAIFNWAIIAPAMPIIGIVAASILGAVAITAGMVCIYKNRMQIKEGLQSVAGKTEKGFKLVADKTIEGASSIKNKINNGSVYVKDKINESYHNSKDSLKRKVAITARRLSDFSDETHYMQKNKDSFSLSELKNVDELLSKTKKAFLHDESNQSVKLVLNAIKANIQVNLIAFEGDNNIEKRFIENLDEKSLEKMVTKERLLEKDKYHCNLIFSRCGDLIEKTLTELKTTSDKEINREENVLSFDSVDNTNVKNKFATIKRGYSLPIMLREEIPKPSRSSSPFNSSRYASSNEVSANSGISSPERIVINEKDITLCRKNLNRTGSLEKLVGEVPSLIKGDISMQIHSEKQIG